MSSSAQPQHAGPSLLGESGYRTGLEWNTNGLARARAAEIIAECRAEQTEVVSDVHLRSEWAAHAVCSPELRAAVQKTIGGAVAVENMRLIRRSDSNKTVGARLGLNILPQALNFVRAGRHPVRRFRCDPPQRPSQPQPVPAQRVGLVTQPSTVGMT